MELPFFDKSDIFTNSLEENHAKIKDEFFNAVTKEQYLEWPESHLFNHGWNVFGLRFQHIDVFDANLLCPNLSNFIKKYDSLIETAGFSILSPGTVINPHVGFTTDVLRCHLGIKVPDGDCCLKVGGNVRKWKEGESFIFDNTIEHEACNRTNEDRIVLLMDLNKNVLLKDFT
jgi:beta-hydroxylase